MKSFVMFHTMLVSASTPIDVGYFICPFKGEKEGKRNICKGLVFGKVPFCLRNYCIQYTKVQKDFSEFLFVDVA